MGLGDAEGGVEDLRVGVSELDDGLYEPPREIRTVNFGFLYAAMFAAYQASSASFGVW